MGGQRPDPDGRGVGNLQNDQVCEGRPLQDFLRWFPDFNGKGTLDVFLAADLLELLL